MTAHSRIIIAMSFFISLIAVSGQYFSFLTTLVKMSWGEEKTEYINARYMNLIFLSVPYLYYKVSKMSNYMLVKAGRSDFVITFSNIVYALGILFILSMPILAMSHDFARLYRDGALELILLINLVLISKIFVPASGCVNIYWVKYQWAILLLVIAFALGLQYTAGYDELLSNNVVYDMF